MTDRPGWLEKLTVDLEEASTAFATEVDGSKRLFALMRAVGAVIDALDCLPEVRGYLRPFTVLVGALDHLSQGSSDPLLAPQHIANRPGASGTRIVEQVAGVFASMQLASGGMSVADADKMAARLLAARGITGKGALLVSRRTIGDWRRGFRGADSCS